MPRPIVAPQLAASRSRVSNGSAVLAGVDGRSAAARRFRDICGALTAELGGGLGEMELLQVRAAAGLQLHVEELTARMARGEPVSSEELTRAGNGAIRALESLRRNKAAKRTRRGTGAAGYLAGRREGGDA